MYTVLGATGHIGSVITKVLLEKGEKVRVVGRQGGKLQQFVSKGAESLVADVLDAEALRRALDGTRAAFLMIPPGITSPGTAAPSFTAPGTAGPSFTSPETAALGIAVLGIAVLGIAVLGIAVLRGEAAGPGPQLAGHRAPGLVLGEPSRPRSWSR